MNFVQTHCEKFGRVPSINSRESIAGYHRIAWTPGRKKRNKATAHVEKSTASMLLMVDMGTFANRDMISPIVSVHDEHLSLLGLSVATGCSLSSLFLFLFRACLYPAGAGFMLRA